MKANYPAAEKGGVRGQPYEARTKGQRNCVKNLLKTAGVKLEGLRTIVDAGCRNGDTTLGILESTSDKTRVIGVEECKEALLIAKAKFGVASPEDIAQISELLKEMPEGFVDSFREDAKSFKGRISFVNSPIEGMLTHPIAIESYPKEPSKQEIAFYYSPVKGASVIKADLIVGFQLLHWLNAGENELPSPEIMQSINKSLAQGGVFISGTSTAFIEISPDEKIDGKKKSEYSIDEHPFVKMVYEKIISILSFGGHEAPRPISEKPPLSMDGLIELFENTGFENIKTGAFLVTPGREEVIKEVVKLRPVHQGRLNGIDDAEAKEKIIKIAIKHANSECESSPELVADPRLVETNIWDAVPYIMATKK